MLFRDSQKSLSQPPGGSLDRILNKNVNFWLPTWAPRRAQIPLRRVPNVEKSCSGGLRAPKTPPSNSTRPQNVEKMYKRKASGWASKEASKGEDAHVTQPNETSFENEVSKGKFNQAHVALEKSSA